MRYSPRLNYVKEETVSGQDSLLIWMANVILNIISVKVLTNGLFSLKRLFKQSYIGILVRTFYFIIV